MTTSAGLPSSPELYEGEYKYWPWGRVLSEIADEVSASAPRGGTVVDYMCGTGFLLGAIRRRRPDLFVEGVDIAESYISYGRKKYPGVELEIGDVFEYSPTQPADVALCTAGLHHVEPSYQPRLLGLIKGQLSIRGHLILAEELLPAYQGRKDRPAAVATLWSELVRWMIPKLPSQDVLTQAARVMIADLEGQEWKLDRIRLDSLLQEEFTLGEEKWVWPGSAVPYGDIILQCLQP